MPRPCSNRETDRFNDCEDWLSGRATTDPGSTSGPDDIALQLYTSGTTGRPRGAMLMNRSLFAFVENAEKAVGLDPDGVHPNGLPLFHVGGINGSLQAFAQGTHVVAFREFDPDVLIAGIERRRVTHLMTVPAVIQLLLSCAHVVAARQNALSARREAVTARREAVTARRRALAGRALAPSRRRRPLDAATPGARRTRARTRGPSARVVGTPPAG